MLCAMAGSGLLVAMRSASADVRNGALLLAAGLAAPIVGSQIVITSDVPTQWTALFCVVSICWIGVRARIVDWRIVVALTIVFVIRVAILLEFSLLPIYSPPMIAILLSSIACLRRNWWLGGLAALFFYDTPLISAPLYLIFSIIRLVVERRIPSEPLAADQPARG
jgi:hypothetical protein